MSKKQRSLLWAAVAHDGRADMADSEKAAYRAWFAKTFGDGEEIQLIVRRKPKDGSQAQAGYYFGPVLRTIAEELGYVDTYELHIELMAKFRPKVRADGSGLAGREQWRDFDLNQRTDYVSDVVTWAEAEMHMRIPRPNEVDTASPDEAAHDYTKADTDVA
jgi:hypothetical protein